MIEIKVAGVSYNNRQDVIEMLTGQEQIIIMPEPDNEADPNALKVMAGGHHIGYVPASLAVQLAPLMRGGALAGKIIEFTGGTPRFPTRGVKIQFHEPDGWEGGLST